MTRPADLSAALPCAANSLSGICHANVMHASTFREHFLPHKSANLRHPIFSAVVHALKSGSCSSHRGAGKYVAATRGGCTLFPSDAANRGGYVRFRTYSALHGRTLHKGCSDVPVSLVRVDLATALCHARAISNDGLPPCGYCGRTSVWCGCGKYGDVHASLAERSGTALPTQLGAFDSRRTLHQQNSRVGDALSPVNRDPGCHGFGLQHGGGYAQHTDFGGMLPTLQLHQSSRSSMDLARIGPPALDSFFLLTDCCAQPSWRCMCRFGEVSCGPIHNGYTRPTISFAGPRVLTERTAMRMHAQDSAEGRQPISCPFCGEGDFDLLGLKMHLNRGWCEVFNSLCGPTAETDPAWQASHGYAHAHPRSGAGGAHEFPRRAHAVTTRAEREQNSRAGATKPTRGSARWLRASQPHRPPSHGRWDREQASALDSSPLPPWGNLRPRAMAAAAISLGFRDTWKRRLGGEVQQMSKRQRNATPLAFRDLLISIAESANLRPRCCEARPVFSRVQA